MRIYSGFSTPCNSHKSVKRDPCLIWKVDYIAWFSLNTVYASRSTLARCNKTVESLGALFFPLVVESFGRWTAHSIKLLKSIAGRVALSANISKSLAYSNLIQQLSIKLWSFNAKMILFRLHSLSPTLNFASSFFDSVYTNHLLT